MASDKSVCESVKEWMSDVWTRKWLNKEEQASNQLYDWLLDRWVNGRLGSLTVCRQEGGAVDLAEVAQHESALQDSITLANQAASGDRFTKTQLEQASTPLQVPSAVWTPYPASYSILLTCWQCTHSVGICQLLCMLHSNMLTCRAFGTAKIGHWVTCGCLLACLCTLVTSASNCKLFHKKVSSHDISNVARMNADPYPLQAAFQRSVYTNQHNHRPGHLRIRWGRSCNVIFDVWFFRLQTRVGLPNLPNS